MKNITTNIKSFVLLLSVLLILPLTAESALIQYSVTGTASDELTPAIRNVTGFMVFSDVPLVNVNVDINNPDTDSSIQYDIVSSMLTIDGIGSASGSGLLRFEWDGSGTFGGFVLTYMGNFMIPRVHFFNSDSSPYNPVNFAEYVNLAPLMTASGETGHFGAFNYSGFLDLKLTAVPVPPAVWLFVSGLVGLSSIARRKKS